MKGRHYFLLFGLSLVLDASGQSSSSANERRTNVLFLMADDLGAQALSCYGARNGNTPHIDRLAERSVVFQRAYCQFPVCGPSRAALMSGMYAQSIGVNGNGQANRLTVNLGERPSMAELFKRNGYYTARVGKIYHMRVPGDVTAGVDGPDHVASWTERFNCQGPEWMTEGEHEQLDSQRVRAERDKHYNLGFGTAFYVVRGSGDGSEQADHKAATKAVELLKAHRDEPFFLAVGFVRPHVPLVAPKRFFAELLPEAMQLPARVENDWDDIPTAGLSLNSKRLGFLGDLDRQRAVLAAYQAAVSFLDEQVGKVLTALEREGLAQRTIVVFSSDHGYHLGEHDLWQKMSLHEESARIPLLVSVPGKAPGSRTALVEQIDLYPTLAELAGFAIPEHVQGESLVRVLDDAEVRVRSHAYSYRRNAHLLRSERHALIAYDDGSLELYDMQEDPHQFRNLAGDEAHAAILAELRNTLASKLEEIAK